MPTKIGPYQLSQCLRPLVARGRGHATLREVSEACMAVGHHASPTALRCCLTRWGWRVEQGVVSLVRGPCPDGSPYWPGEVPPLPHGAIPRGAAPTSRAAALRLVLGAYASMGVHQVAGEEVVREAMARWPTMPVSPRHPHGGPWWGNPADCTAALRVASAGGDPPVYSTRRAAG